jgi:Transglycosylase SLT domain
LRRLARIMAPNTGGDPLAYTFDEDPQLRAMFGLSTPLELPGQLETPVESSATNNNSPRDHEGTNGVELNRAVPTPVNPSNPKTGAPPLPTTISPAPGPVSMLSNVWTIAPDVALAAEIGPNTQVNATEILALGRKLHEVVVSKQNVLAYRHNVGNLLDLAARYQLQDDALDVSAQRAWPILLKAAAWQESCWRQYVIKHRRVWYLESKSGDIGLMQVNKYVWRGFYSLPRLKWDIVYNLSAGSQILQRLLAESINHLHTNDAAVLARSAYAAYNGGPAAYNRWREPHESRLPREIDLSFWLKYRSVAAGLPFDILSCASQWDRLHAD